MGAVHIAIGRTLGLCVAKAATATRIGSMQNLSLEGQSLFLSCGAKT